MLATSGDRNLSAHAKRDELVERFGESGYDYVGNSRADLPVWETARKAYLVDVDARVEATCSTKDKTVLRSEVPIFKTWIHALRLHQWAKNLLLFVPLIASHRLEVDLVLAASETDAKRVRGLCPAARVAVFPNSIPLREVPCVPEAEEVAFSGNLEYHPNVSAVRYFATQVWPALRRERPGLVWRLIGKNPHAVQDIVASDPRIELTGEVADALPEIARARVLVVPVLAGSGTRVKIMEAWAAARPVVSSTIGAEGLPVEHGKNIVLADDPRDWIEQVLKLLSNEAMRRELGANGRLVFEQKHSWPAAWKRLDEVLRPLLGLAPAAIVS